LTGEPVSNNPSPMIERADVKAQSSAAGKQTVAIDWFWPTAGIHHRQVTGSLIAVPPATRE